MVNTHETKSQPMRTCVGCGEPKAKRELIRVSLKSRRQYHYRRTVKPLVVVLIYVNPWTCFEAAYKAKH